MVQKGNSRIERPEPRITRRPVQKTLELLARDPAKAPVLRARSISGTMLVKFGLMPWRQQPVLFLETPLNALMARCGTSILRQRFRKSGCAVGALGLFFRALDLGRCPRLGVWTFSVP